MARFPSLLSFALHLTSLAGQVHEAQRVGLKAAARLVRREAQSAIGTYTYGWPRLSPETIARKRSGDTPLLETGQMRNTLSEEVVSHERAVVFSDDPKAAYHELGTSRIPPRPFLSTAAKLKEPEVLEEVAKPVLALLQKSQA